MDNDGQIVQELGLVGGFVSRYLHSLDPKKRFTIPSGWRDQVGRPAALYILPSFSDETCLYAYPAAEMAKRLEKLRKVGIADKRARSVARFLASRSDLVSWDSQGRIRVKDELLDFARLAGQVRIVGAFDHFELWNPELWDEADSVEPIRMSDVGRYLDI